MRSQRLPSDSRITKMDTTPVYKEIFIIPFKMMGLTIGRDGANIKKSKTIKGVWSVSNEKQQDGYRFVVIGESHEAVHEARCVLEFKQKAYTVPKHLAGQVIGKNGNVIKKVIEKSLVKKIVKQNREQITVVTFDILGSTEAIERAVLLLNNKLEEIECNNKRFLRRCTVKKDKKKVLYNGGVEHSFKAKYNVRRYKTQGKKPSKSKTPEEDCFEFFVENKMFKRIDYVKKRRQEQRAFQNFGRGDVKVKHENQTKLTKRNLPINVQLFICEIVHSNSSFKDKTQCKNKTEKAKVKNNIIKRDHGNFNHTKARFQYNCLGKYIEAAITNIGLNEVLRVRSLTDCDDDRCSRVVLDSSEEEIYLYHRRTSVSLDSSEFSNEEGELYLNDRRTSLNLDSSEFSNEEEELYLYDRRTSMNFDSSECSNEGEEVYLYDRRQSISLDSSRISNERGDICVEKCIENDSDEDDEQSWWLKLHPTKDTWEEWDCDEESCIHSE